MMFLNDDDPGAKKNNKIYSIGVDVDNVHT